MKTEEAPSIVAAPGRPLEDGVTVRLSRGYDLV